MDQEEQKPAPSRPPHPCVGEDTLVLPLMTTKREDVEARRGRVVAYSEGGRVKVTFIPIAERRSPCSKSPTPQSRC
jgi:hypothetical protein